MGRVGNRRPSRPSTCPAWAGVRGGSSNLGPRTPSVTVGVTADPSPPWCWGMECEALGDGGAQAWTGSQGPGVSMPCPLPWA